MQGDMGRSYYTTARGCCEATGLDYERVRSAVMTRWREPRVIVVDLDIAA